MKAADVKGVVRNRAIVALGASPVPRRPRSRQVAMLHETPDRARLRTCLEWLGRSYDIVPVADVVDGSAGSARSAGANGRPRLALTFDDGYASWHEVAAPVLEELGFPATFFVTSGFVGLDREAAHRFRRERMQITGDLPPLSLDQLRDLAGNLLFEIGGHTDSHIDFATASSPEEIRTEVDGNRRQLEDWTGRRVRWFAYPFGSPAQLTHLAIEHVRRAGFDGAFTALPGPLDTAPNTALLPRQHIDPNEGPTLWRARLNGGYERFFAIKRRALRITLPPSLR